MGDDRGGVVEPPAALRDVSTRWRTIVDGTRIWRDEYASMSMERCKLLGEMQHATRSMYEAGGDYNIEKKIETNKKSIEKLDAGWPRRRVRHTPDDLDRPGRAARRRRARAVEPLLAASTRVVCEALAQQAKLMWQPAPLRIHQT